MSSLGYLEANVVVCGFEFNVVTLGFSDHQWAEYINRRRLLTEVKGLPLPAALSPKKFVQKHKEIPVLGDYSGKLPGAYWGKWTRRSYGSLVPARSWVCPDKLVEVASKVGYKNRERLERVVQRLREGADIGCRGPARLPTCMPNSSSAIEHGVRLADALQDWVKAGLAFGPCLPEEMPWRDYTVNPLKVVIRPDGKARICINMSSPHSKPSDPVGKPASVNSGIDGDLFPASMSTTKSFCLSLMRAGCPGELCKLDWRSAYKHQAVRAEDHNLQVFEFGGRLFGELFATFGGVSSAGIFDNLAKLVKELVIIKAEMDKRLVSQVLDDSVACGAQGDGSVRRFYLCYRQLAEEIGVLLADESEPDKAFNVASSGLVLGIMYDLVSWQWWLPDEKLVPLVWMLASIRDSEVVKNCVMLSVNGKLNHYMWLVPGGPWQRGFLLLLQDARARSSVEFRMNDLARK